MNRASAATIGEHVLLNAVRASLDLPMSFTKLAKHQTENMAKGSFAPKVPFGPDAIRSYDLGATVNWSSGVFLTEYVDVNTAGALAKLNQTLTYDAIERYVRDGVPPALVFTIFVTEVEVHKALAAAMVVQVSRKCRTPAKADQDTCDELERIVRDCGHVWWNNPGNPAVKLEGGHEFFIVRGRAGSACAFLEFQSLLLTLRLSGYGADLRRTTKYERVTTPEQKHILLPTTSTAQAVTFREDAVRRVFLDYEGKLQKLKHKDKSQVDRSPVKLVLRSPRSVLTYLGDLIALQNFATEPYLPEIVVRGGQRITVFRVIRGSLGLEVAALAVISPYGDSFFVPRPDYGSQARDQTLRVLWMAAEVVNGAISEKDFPAPASVTVRAIQ